MSGNLLKVPRICCQDCPRLYIGKTSRNLPKRIKEHKVVYKSGNFSKAFGINNITMKQKFDYQHSNIIAFILDKNKYRKRESSSISHYNTIEQRPGFYKISPYLAKIIDAFQLTPTTIIKKTFLSVSTIFSIFFHAFPFFSFFFPLSLISSFFHCPPIQTDFL